MFTKEVRAISKKTIQQRKEKADQHRAIIQRIAKEGKTIQEACKAVNLSHTTVRLYARKWKIQFKRKEW
jgi:DNA invertase Pin-like site-specific DNA recombinase